MVGALPPRKVANFLFNNVLVIGVSSLLPMLYLSSQSIACIPTVQVDEGETYYSECSGVSYPVFSINISLLSVLLMKVVIAPLSNATITVENILTLDVPNLLKFELLFAGISFCCNLILFGRIKEVGKVDGTTQCLLALAISTLLLAVFLELAFMVLFRRSADGAGRRSTVAGDVREMEMGDLGGIVGGFT
ncbi:hypothetical protein TrRE_jg8401 [Triparma retinervis]|uniref:Uncharacterized protein n=1 Tax=Triparma retinervis TaxID=2557542 RepID=A0A9W6Z6G0_9STRA|nr:hypothetical protein TrRE_jg8401 [Triparma retinervis]